MAPNDRWALAPMGAMVPTRTSPPLAASVCSYKGSNSFVCLRLSLGNLVHLSGTFEAKREHQGYRREWLLGGVYLHQPHQSARRARETWGWLRPPDPDIHSSISLYLSLCPREKSLTFSGPLAHEKVGLGTLHLPVLKSHAF